MRKFLSALSLMSLSATACSTREHAARSTPSTSTSTAQETSSSITLQLWGTTDGGASSSSSASSSSGGGGAGGSGTSSGGSGGAASTGSSSSSSSSSSTSSSGCALDVIAAGGAGSEPSAIATDGAYVFYAAGGDVLRVGACGGDSVVVASGLGPFQIVLDDQNVYWSDAQAGTVSSAPKAGGAPQVIAVGQPMAYPKIIGLAVTPTAAYWTTASAVMQAPLGGGAATPISGVPAWGALAADAAGVYWQGGNYPGNGVWAYSPGSNTRINTTATQGTSSFIALDAANVYWTEGSTGNVLACPRSGCGSAPKVLAANQADPQGIASDGVNVYWTSGGDPLGNVSKCSVNGCGPTPTVLASGQATPAGITVDGASVYWTNFADGTVHRAAK